MVMRYEFYRDGWRTMLTILVVLSVTSAALLFGLLWSMSRPVQSHYFATEGGRVVPIIPSDLPFVKKEYLLSWASEAVSSSFTIDFQNYRKKIQENKRFFTEQGFEEYVSALQTSTRLPQIIENYMVSSAVPEGAPVVVNEGVVNGIYAWKIRMPVIVSYQSGVKSSPSERLMVSMVVVRVPTYENSSGIGISQFVAKKM